MPRRVLMAIKGFWEKLELERVYMYLELGFVEEDARDALVQSSYVVSIVCVWNGYDYTVLLGLVAIDSVTFRRASP